MRIGFYERRIFPWLNDRLGADPELRRLRADVVKPANGRVIEVGFGSGANLPYYPRAVTSVVGIEPNVGMLERAASRIRAFDGSVEIVVGRAERLPFADRSFDTAVSTLTLCSVLDPIATLRELSRVLRDDGQLILMEHGRSLDPSVARWQDRLNPLQKIVACGCHLNRPVADLAASSGFSTDGLHQSYLPKVPRTHGCFSMGVLKRAPGGGL